MYIENNHLNDITPFNGETADDDYRPTLASARSWPTSTDEWGPGERISHYDGYNLSHRAKFEHLPRLGTPRVPHHSTPRLAKMDSYTEKVWKVSFTSSPVVVTVAVIPGVDRGRVV